MPTADNRFTYALPDMYLTCNTSAMIDSDQVYEIPYYDDLAPPHCEEPLSMSKDRILQIISSVPALSQRITDLETKNFSLKTRCSNLEQKPKTLALQDHPGIFPVPASTNNSATVWSFEEALP